MQLVQLQQAQQRFKDNDIGLVAISYDSEAILKDFAQRHNITFPLLADPQSAIIRKYGVLNPEAKGMSQGMAFPGFFYIDPGGNIKEKFFEAAYTDRYTANSVVARLFPELVEQATRKIEAPHIDLTLQQSDQAGVPGSRITLIAELSLGPDLHVYAPGVTGGYKPVELKLEPAADVKAHPAVFPRPKVLFLQAINETVPVFEGRFRIAQDITLSADKSFVTSLGQGKDLAINGELKYQTCNDTTCFPPASVPVSWKIHVLPLDMQRSPEAIQHRASH